MALDIIKNVVLGDLGLSGQLSLAICYWKILHALLSSADFSKLMF